ncbi:MAG: CatB-related O-acetyltransferase [Bacteroidaceae bacterium]|nr:CatB-related O-acetyltransferase [Bacteroidaceae bacterium]
MTLGYLYSKFFKIVLQGKSILNSKIDKTAKIYAGTEFYDSTIGRHSYVGYNSEIHNCEIGAFCSIANNIVVGGAKHPLDWVSTSPVFYNVGGGTGKHIGNLEIEPLKRTIIGNDVWIGSCVLIMQGVHVGDGAVIGAGSIVTKDVPPYAIVAGNPAKILRYRFDEKMIGSLLTSKWWELSDEELAHKSQYINRPNLFLEEFLGRTDNQPVSDL